MKVLAEKTIHVQMELHERPAITRDELTYNSDRHERSLRQKAIREHGQRFDNYLAAMRRFNGTTISGGR